MLTNTEDPRVPAYYDHSITNASPLLGYDDYTTVNSNIEGPSGLSKEVLGYDITYASINQAIAIGKKHDVRLGKYAVDATDGYLLEGAQLAGVPLDADFNVENQEKIFKALFKKYGPSLWREYQDLSDQDKLFLDETFKLMNTEKFDSAWGYHNPAILSETAYHILYEEGRYATV